MLQKQQDKKRAVLVCDGEWMERCFPVEREREAESGCLSLCLSVRHEP